MESKKADQPQTKSTVLNNYLRKPVDKVRKKYANLGHSIVMVQLERSSQGLGLSLAGHKDRNCMAVFVCGLNPKGAAFKTGGIEVGDEILEVKIFYLIIQMLHYENVLANFIADMNNILEDGTSELPH
ncbi:hypothetical protein HHI36_003169 [Cryptolaemus montrouzieri]|uniref:PDZ domain-containing protein n=1 Tax=Cryptolaemus montrouzieri TaxID=559131 RepID=A0ABD2PCS6_9CUCU